MTGTLPAWLALALDDAARPVAEVRGPGDSPEILAYWHDAGLSDHVAAPGFTGDEIPWCAAAVGAWLARAGVTPSYSPVARSYIRWHDGLKDLRRGAGSVVVLTAPHMADWQGHVGFLLREDAGSVTIVGGNQRDRVSIARYSLARGWRVLAYRWPRSVPNEGPDRYAGDLAAGDQPTEGGSTR